MIHGLAAARPAKTGAEPAGPLGVVRGKGVVNQGAHISGLDAQDLEGHVAAARRLLVDEQHDAGAAAPPPPTTTTTGVEGHVAAVEHSEFGHKQ